MNVYEELCEKLAESGLLISMAAPEGRTIANTLRSRVDFVTIGNDDASALYLLERFKNDRGSFDLWEVKTTPMQIGDIVGSVEQRLPDRRSSKEAIAERFREMFGQDSGGAA